MSKYIAGPFRVTIGTGSGNIAIGDTDGVYLGWSSSMEMIDNTDSAGRTPLDGVYRGGACFLTVNVLTVDPLALAVALWPQSATLGNIGVIGRLASAFSNSITLAPIKGSNAALQVNANIVASAVIPAPDFPMRINLGPSLSKITLRFQLLPYTNNTNLVWFHNLTTSAVTPTQPSGYIAGAYGVTWNNVTIGDTDLNSLQLEWALHYEPIVGDSGGDTVQDLVYQGASAYLNLIMNQVDAAGAKALWPYNDLPGVWQTANGLIGSLHGGTPALAKVLSMVPVAGTPAAGIIGSITGTGVLAPNFEVLGRKGPVVQRVPFRAQFFPTGTPPTQLFTIT